MTTIQTVVIYEDFPRDSFLEKSYMAVAKKLEKEGDPFPDLLQLPCENAIIHRPKLLFQESGIYLQGDINSAANVDNLLFGVMHYVVGVFGKSRKPLMILDPTSTQFNIPRGLEVITPSWLVMCMEFNTPA